MLKKVVSLKHFFKYPKFKYVIYIIIMLIFPIFFIYLDFKAYSKAKRQGEKREGEGDLKFVVLSKVVVWIGL